MSVKYIPGCECCGNGYVFAPYAYSLYRQRTDNGEDRQDPWNGDQFYGIELVLRLAVLDQKDGILIKTIEIHREPAKEVTYTHQRFSNSPRETYKAGYPYSVKGKVCECNESIVMIVFSINLTLNNFQVRGLGRGSDTEDYASGSDVAFVDTKHIVATIRYSDFEILAKEQLEIEDVNMHVVNCCMNRDSQLYAGFALNTVPDPNGRPAMPREEYYNSYVKPVVSRECPILKIDWDGNVLETYSAGMDQHEVAFLISDMFVDPSDRLLVCMSSCTRAFRRVLEGAGGSNRYYWLESCLKIYPDEKVYRVTRSVTDQPATNPAFGTIIRSACTDKNGNIYISARGYSEENIFPENYVDFPEDLNPLALNNASVIDADIRLGQVYDRHYDPYESIFKHLDTNNGDHTDWEMLLPRYYPVFLGPNVLGKIRMTDFGSIVYANNVVETGVPPVIIHNPFDLEHNIYEPTDDSDIPVLTIFGPYGGISAATTIGITLRDDKIALFGDQNFSFGGTYDAFRIYTVTVEGIDDARWTPISDPLPVFEGEVASFFGEGVISSIHTELLGDDYYPPNSGIFRPQPLIFSILGDRKWSATPGEVISTGD